jgi:hypothetical protein
MRGFATPESRGSALAIAIAVGVFAALLVIAGPFFPTFDEQKYLGIAQNLWAGRGITTVFGVPFLSHAPLWSVLLGAPHALVGADDLAFGQLMDAVAGIAFIVAAAWLGWRIRPVAGAITAIALVGMLYLHDQTRTARLDVPAATLGLAYLIVGLEAVRRASARWSVVAGVVFAIGFLVKEIDLPLAPAPLLAGALWGLPWRSILRTAGWTALAGALGVSWWFVLFAKEEGVVYRLGTPGWTLVPLGAILTTLIFIGILADRYAALPELGRALGVVERRVGDRVRPWGRALTAWGIAFVWAALLTAVFLKNARLTGTGGLAPAQLALYARTWFGPLAIVLLVVVAAAALAVVVAWLDPARIRRRPVADLTVATICGLPLVLLVIAVGEPPRNYLAQLAIVVALASVGLVWVVERVLAASRAALLVPTGTIVGAIAGLAVRELIGVALHMKSPPGPLAAFLAIGGGIGALVAVGLVVIGRLPAPRADSARTQIGGGLVAVALVAACGVLTAHALAPRADSTNPARAAAVSTVGAWLRSHLDPSQTVAFGSFLGYDMALELEGRNRAVQVVQRLAVGSATAPEGIVWPGEAAAGDWIAVDIAPRNASQFQAFRVPWVRNALKKGDVSVLVYTTGIDTAAPAILGVFTPDHGFEMLQHWTFPVGGGAPPIETSVFAVHLDELQLDPDHVHISAEALHRLTDFLAGHRSDARAAAAALVERAVITPPDPTADADLARLRAIAAGG